MIILNETKVKYEHLSTLLEDKLIDIRFGNDVNVIVDLKEVIRKFFRPNVLPEGSKGRNVIEEIASDIINIVGHYRNFLYKRGKYSSFFFLYSKSECDLLKAKHLDYKKEYYAKYFHSVEDAEKVEVTRKSVEIVERVVNRIPNCRFIDTAKFDEFTVAKFLIQQSKPSEVNLILSNDEMMAQLVGKNTFMLNMKGIKTRLLDTANAVSVLTDRETKLSVNMLPLLLSIAGAEKYSLDNVNTYGLIKAVKLVESLVAGGKLIDMEHVDFPVKPELLSAAVHNDKVVIDNVDKLRRNYGIITNSDVLYSNNAELTIMFNKPRTVHSWDYFLELNAKVFTTYSLNIDMLMRGEQAK